MGAGSREAWTARDYRDSSAESTSPGLGWRPSSFLEKIFFPPTVTSKTPPEDGINRSPATSSPFALRISSVTRTACGRYPQALQYSIAISSFPAIDDTSPDVFQPPVSLAGGSMSRDRPHTSPCTGR